MIIVDEFTGRMMPGRRCSEGLHQAIEAKEGVRVRRQNVTLATITFQNYFRMYDKLAGMTGTAKTEAEEFHRIYNLEVVTIPTNRPMVREDYADLVFKNEDGKFRAVVDEIEEMREQGRPVLVGTTSIETSERLSEHDAAQGHRARGPQRQAARARGARSSPRPGSRASVTIATNMAGRGTDIVLGPGVAEAGGLHIIGTERHESRRIDNQLRGRAGRQGDPGSRRFYVSLEDELMRRFGSERIRAHGRLGMDEDTPIEHRDHLQVDRERPDEGRRAQLRHPQARRPVRRRDEQAARGDLRRPRRDRRRRGRRSKGRSTWSPTRSKSIVAAHWPEKRGTSPTSMRIARRRISPSYPTGKVDESRYGGSRAARDRRRSSKTTPTSAYAEVEARFGAGDDAHRSSATSCSQ